MIVEYDVVKGYVGLHFSGLYLPLRVNADCYVSDRWIGFSWHSQRFCYGFSRPRFA